MIAHLFKKRYHAIIILVVLAGIFFRFYNLSWGSPFFFHPDERNIASSISQLSYPDKLNPNFFAYGSLPIYATYFIGVFVNIIENFITGSSTSIKIVSFENAILIGRTISAFFSVLMLFFIYAVGKNIGGKITGTVSLLLASLSVGLIQYAHFSTFEIWLSFFTLLLCHVVIKFISTRRYIYFIYVATVLGVLISIKISSAIFLPLCIIILFISDLIILKKEKKVNFILIERIFLRLTMLMGISLVIVIFTSPYFWIDNNSFLSSIHYESSVALGKMKVFYTQGFENTIPILYQSFRVYPFILNPIVALISAISLPYICYMIYRKKNLKLLIIFSFLLLTYFSQVFLFVKWTRYYIPTLSFIFIILGFFLHRLALQKEKRILKKQFIC